LVHNRIEGVIIHESHQLPCINHLRLYQIQEESNGLQQIISIKEAY